MICLGLDDAGKDAVVRRYCDEHGIRKVFLLTPERFRPALAVEVETVTWPDIIEYRFFYRLLQEVGRDTLVIVNECLRTQNRYDLTYNCIRHFLNQTPHQIVFQYLPLIDTVEDFMILFDFDTRSRWKRERFSPGLLGEATIEVAPVPVQLRPVPVSASPRIHYLYAQEKVALLAAVRGDPEKDPHLIPRNLLLVSGKAKLPRVVPGRRYIGRNNRFKLPNLETYREVAGAGPWTVFEFCHNFIDFADFLAVSRQVDVEVMVADTKAEHWYLQRFIDWTRRLADAYATLRR